MRRQTLASLNPNASTRQRSQSRFSEVGLGKGSRRARSNSMSKKRGMSIGSRSSFGFKPRKSIGSTSSRNSGVFSGKGSGSRQSSAHYRGNRAVKDPRDLGTKAHIVQNIKEVVTFLATHAFPMEVSAKMLHSPSTQLFVDILEFLISHIDGNFEFDDWVKELPPLLDFLGYPFKVRKMTLQNIGSPHAWPYLLGVLVWLIELINYRDVVEMKEDEGISDDVLQESSPNPEQWFFQYLENAYARFMEGVDLAEIENDLAEVCNEKAISVEKENQASLEETEHLQNEINELRAKKERFIALNKKKEKYSEDLVKMKKALDHLSQQSNGLRKQHSSVTKKNEELSQLLEEAARERRDLQDVVDAQDLSFEDVARLQKEEKMMSDLLQKLNQQEHDLRSQSWDMNMQITKLRDSAEELVSIFNNVAADLQLIPSSAANADGNDIVLKIMKGADRLLNKDVVHDVKPHLVRFQETMYAAITRFENEKESLEKRIRDMKTQVGEKQEDLKDALEAKETAYTSLRDTEHAFRKQAKDKINEVEQLELDLVKFKNRHSDELKDLETTYELLDADIQSMSETQVSNERQLIDQIMQTVEMLTQHKAEISESIADLHNSILEISKTIVE